MANITVTIESEKDLTIFTVEGNLTATEIIAFTKEYYSKHPTKLVLWDGSKGTVSSITALDFQKIAQKTKNQIEKRKGGKTALVGSFDIDFGLARMYGIYAEIERIPVQYRVFRNTDEAMVWLQS